MGKTAHQAYLNAKEKIETALHKERMSKAVILFRVSRYFLASKYITEQERPLAMRLMSADKAVVVPVLLSACSWRDEDFAALEKLPRKDFAQKYSNWPLLTSVEEILLTQRRKDAKENP